MRVVVADDAGYLFARVVAAAHGIPPQRRLCALALRADLNTRALQEGVHAVDRGHGRALEGDAVGFGFGFGFGSGRLRRPASRLYVERAPKQRAR